jgi:hypothetical protein
MSDQPERRKGERREWKATITLPRDEAEALMLSEGYTGLVIGHVHQGKLQKIALPNPKGRLHV